MTSCIAACGAQVTMERGRLAGALQGAQQELARYREATGQSAEDLQAERAGKAALESRTRAQVCAPHAGESCPFMLLLPRCSLQIARHIEPIPFHFASNSAYPVSWAP